jgi:4-hydroxybenzoate polyprenyltransferase
MREKKGGWGIFVAALRPSHIVKNFFIFLPLIFAEKLFVFPENLRTLAAFILFSLAAGSGYLVNDLSDLRRDSLHPVKRLRPMASGTIDRTFALTGAVILSVCSVALSFVLDRNAGLLVLSYLLLNIVYTLRLKKLVIIDVFCIAAFFLLRVWLGSITARATPSHWILFMTILLALFLAFTKRRQELILLGEDAQLHRSVLSRYSHYFIDQMIGVITSSIVVVYMLYTIDARTVREFGTNHLFFGLPFVYYGIFRYLYLIHKENKGDDPTLVLLTDAPMQVNVFLWLLASMAVIYLKM